jgi:chromosome segregation protein
LAQEREVYRLEAEEQKNTDRGAMLDMERNQDEEDSAVLLAERSQSERELDELERRREELEENLEEAQCQRRELKGSVDELHEKATAHHVARGTLREKQQGAHSSYQRVVDYHAEGEGRLRQLQEEQQTCRQRLERLLQDAKETEQRLEQAHKGLSERETRLDSEAENWRGFEGQQQDLEARRVRLLQEDREQEQRMQLLRQETTELNLKLEYLVHQIQERYHLDIRRESSLEEEQPLAVEPLEEKIEKLRERIGRIGEVNLAAIQEYDEQRQRYEFLVAQRDDLVQSLDGLKKAISRIDRTTRKRFLRTLEAVNSRLTEVFPLLFHGGSAQLQLLDQRNPLEAGVEILVHPPGKRLTSMGLLSGGEKALAAVALLFSLYMIRPSPFCILDEVDATLDEANIDRFNEVLKEIGRDSQVIMVTHNKTTMEISDLLLGVTMEEPGISKIISVHFQGEPSGHG